MGHSLALFEDADAAFALPDFSIALAGVLRDEPQLVRAWQRWSEDQRWTPSAAIMETRVSWILTSGKAVHERIHTDTGAATRTSFAGFPRGSHVAKC